MKFHHISASEYTVGKNEDGKFGFCVINSIKNLIQYKLYMVTVVSKLKDEPQKTANTRVEFIFAADEETAIKFSEELFVEDVLESYASRVRFRIFGWGRMSF